jgi:ferrochelatase
MPNARFAKEPSFTHGQTEKTAVLYCNLGTPDAATTAAVRRYLSEFLGDPRVVEIPRLLWMLILHGVILRIRPPARPPNTPASGPAKARH